MNNMSILLKIGKNILRITSTLVSATLKKLRLLKLIFDLKTGQDYFKYLENRAINFLGSDIS